MDENSDARIDEFLYALEQNDSLDVFPEHEYKEKIKDFFEYMKKKGAVTFSDAYNMLKDRKIDSSIVELWINEGFVRKDVPFDNEVLSQGIINGYPEFKKDMEDLGYNPMTESEKEKMYDHIVEAYRDIKMIEYGDRKSITKHNESIEEHISGYCELFRVSEDVVKKWNGPFNYLFEKGYENFQKASEVLRSASLDQRIVAIWVEEGILENTMKLDSGILYNAIREGYPELFED